MKYKFILWFAFLSFVIRFSPAYSKSSGYGVKRPQLHFSVRKGQSMDANGLYFYKNQFYMSYQYLSKVPTATLDYSKIRWGQASSQDLISWVEKPPILFPEKDGTPPFSGSAVVDIENTSGFKVGVSPPIVLVFTCAGYISKPKGYSSQCLAISTDEGQSWFRYSGNPVLGKIKPVARDPMVIWHKQSKSWIMVLAINDQPSKQEHLFSFYGSKNLKTWNFLSSVELPGAVDCPDFFLIKGPDEKEKWILWGGNTNYLIGDFDGSSFTPTQPMFKSEVSGGASATDYGSRYCSQSWKLDNGEHISIGWLRDNKVSSKYGLKYSQQMTFPVQLSLKLEFGRYFVEQKFLNTLKDILSIQDYEISNTSEIKKALYPKSDVFFAELGFDLVSNETVVVKVKDFSFKINATKKTLSFESHLFEPHRNVVIPLKTVGNDLQILSDSMSLEIVVNGVNSISLVSDPNYTGKRLSFQKGLKLNYYRLGLQKN